MDMITKVKQTIMADKLFSVGDRIIVGVSGGPDSVALLHVLNHLRSTMGLQLIVAHFNHQLRKDSDKDQDFTRKIAEGFGYPFVTAKAPHRRAQPKGSIEEWARHQRFAFFKKTAKRYSAQAIALGHTQDDLAETVLMRVLRGTGLSGLRGIITKRQINDCLFVRPLLNVKRKEVLAFLRKKKAKFCTDATNKNKNFFRNRVRLDLLPYLEKNFNPNVKKVLSHLSDVTLTDYDFITHHAALALEKIIKPGTQKEKIILSLEKFLSLHPALQRMVIRLAIERIKGNTRRLTLIHWREVEDLLTRRTVNAIVHLPQNISIQKTRHSVILSLRKT
ncbi:MAG: tRNA lysidine(34) synthetase TilS [Candidatus Omnitrophota bacterium]